MREFLSSTPSPQGQGQDGRRDSAGARGGGHTQRLRTVQNSNPTGAPHGRLYAEEKYTTQEIMKRRKSGG